MKRALPLALCAMMTVGNLPSVTYASDLSPADTGVVSQAEEADETQSAEEAAQAYLKENFINATDKVITTGGNGVVKSEDGLTYNIGLKTPNGGFINSLRLKYLDIVFLGEEGRIAERLYHRSRRKPTQIASVDC